MFQKNEYFENKAKEHQKSLKHTAVYPKTIVEIADDEQGFQRLSTRAVQEFSTPYMLKNGDSIILDFGRHCTGYLHYALNHMEGRITDAPVVLRFSFGELPLELRADPDQYAGGLGSGWLQNETKSIVFTPYDGSLERRYSFRYLRIERIDQSTNPSVIKLEELYVDCVSAVLAEDAKHFDIPDEKAKKIYDLSVRTLAECAQDVYEDGPKRDRRMWIGDVRLEALVDYKVFQNMDLIKRCIYLFAAYKTPDGYVAPYVFPDSPPYVDGWCFQDYALFLISCVYDYVEHTGDVAFLEELYEELYQQFELAMKNVEAKEPQAFIDWCPDLDKQVAKLGVYLYTFNQLKELGKQLGRDVTDVEQAMEQVTKRMMEFFDADRGLFVTAGGQVSIHSQIWAILSGRLAPSLCQTLLDKIKNTDFAYFIHTPYMMHFYIEALYNNGRRDEAMALILDYWGKMVEFGFDCCLEVFNPDDHFDSPYNAAEINSACHAWSCTPAYWIYRYYTDQI